MQNTSQHNDFGASLKQGAVLSCVGLLAVQEYLRAVEDGAREAECLALA